MSILFEGKRFLGLGCVMTLALLFGASAASAETLLMPKRDFLMGASEVVWGVTTQANATPFVLDYGDSSAQSSGTVTDRSYIAFNHTFALSGTFTVQLCVGAGAAIPGCTGELASVVVNVFNSALLSPADLRGLNINRAIENGLRYLWTVQGNRAANFPASNFTSWSNQSFTALVVLAFENHGYKLPNNDVAPTGLYEKYIVQRGLNQIFNGLSNQTLNVQTNLNPCVGPGIEAAPCIGFEDFSNNVGYSTAIASLPISGSSALQRHVGALNANVAGKTYGEILQRILNAVAWNQIDSGISQGGWAYGAANNSAGSSDGSVVGWDLLALLDGTSAGAVSPAAVKTEFGAPGHAFENHRNDSDGSFDYTANTSELADDFVGKNLAKTSIGLQGLYYLGEVNDTFPRVAQTRDEINRWWLAAPPAGANYACGNGTYNKGCGYGMFNAFKALKLEGISLLSNVNRPAGSIGDPDDWYADYVDWLVTNQTSPTTLAGGNWAAMYFSSSANDTSGNAALAELILAPVALIAPDPTLFSTVGLTPFSDTNPVNTDHTVTAFVQSSGGAPIAGATVGFTVLTGPNAGASGTCAPVGCVSGGDGLVAFTYHDSNGAGHDTIQAHIGTLLSNIVDKFWVIPTIKCDANGDGVISPADLVIIRNANGQVASGTDDPRDGNSDGAINLLDVRYCQLRLNAQTP